MIQKIKTKVKFLNSDNSIKEEKEVYVLAYFDVQNKFMFFEFEDLSNNKIDVNNNTSFMWNGKELFCHPEYRSFVKVPNL